MSMCSLSDATGCRKQGMIAMKASAGGYARARDVGHAIALLAAADGAGRVLAGGQSLVAAMNMRLSAGDLLVDISRLSELSGVTDEGDAIRIGALTRHVEIGADAYGFMCLTSLEYDQAYLPKEFLCLDCVRSEKTREILRKGWSKESIYLVYKTGNEMNVQEIDVSNLDSSSIITYYQSPSSNGGRLGEQTQCTRSNRARASCVTYAGGCLLLFEETDG